MILLFVALGAAETLRCPPGASWVRERQQRTPVTEPAPVAQAVLEAPGQPESVIVLRPGQRHRVEQGPHALVCSYADGSEQVLMFVADRTRVRP